MATEEGAFNSALESSAAKWRGVECKTRAARRTHILHLKTCVCVHYVEACRLEDEQMSTMSNPFTLRKINWRRNARHVHPGLSSRTIVTYTTLTSQTDLDGHRTLHLLDTIGTCALKLCPLRPGPYSKVIECPPCYSTLFHPRSPYGVAKLCTYWNAFRGRSGSGAFCRGGSAAMIRGAE